jgi:hypothetical protein
MYSGMSAAGPTPSQNSRKLHVKNVGDMADEDLRYAFAKYGKIENGRSLSLSLSFC